MSLSDRFGLWLGFHHCSQDDYLAMVHGYAKHFRLDPPPDRLEAEALEWATTRGSRSGRTAWQFIQDLAGRLGKPLDAAGVEARTAPATRPVDEGEPRQNQRDRQSEAGGDRLAESRASPRRRRRAAVMKVKAESCAAA